MISPLIFLNFSKKDRLEKKRAKEVTRLLDEKKKELVKKKNVMNVLGEEKVEKNSKETIINNKKNTMEITTEQVKKLRDQTGISIMQ
jgi:hypothetical protein